MAKNILVINVDIRETRVALIENGIIAELHLERQSAKGTLGNVYLGKVSRVLPGMQAAFIDIGQERAAFLHVEDLIRPDDFEAYLAGKRSGPADDESTHVHAAEPEKDAAAPPPPAQQAAPPRANERGEGGREGSRRSRGRDRGRDRRDGRDAPAPARSGPDSDLGLPKYSATSVEGEARPPTVDASDDNTELLVASTTDADDAADAGDDDLDLRGSADRDDERDAVDDASDDEELVDVGDDHVGDDADPSADSDASDDEDASDDDASGDDASGDDAEDDEDADDEDASDDDAGGDDDGASDDDASGDDEGAESDDASDASAEEESDTGTVNVEGDAANGDPTAAAPEASAGAIATTPAEDEAARRAPRSRSRRGSRGRRRSGSTAERRNSMEAEKANRPDTATTPSPQGDRRAQGRREKDKDKGKRDGRGNRGDRDRGRGSSGRSSKADPLRISKTTPIREVVREGQEVIVQVSKEPIGTKGARVTSHISLPGRYVVYLPTVEHVGISKRIGSDKERGRLREAIEAMKPPSGGLIVRTLAEGLTKKSLKADVGYLVRLWGEIARKREQAPRAPECLYAELDLVLKVARDLLNDDIEEVVIDNREEFIRLRRFIEMFMPERVEALKLYEGQEPIFDAYGIEEEIGRALSRKVPLNSGGYLIIDQAEALTAIDVNTGRYVGKGSKDLEDTILTTNLEAVEEIAYQLRFRNIGGLIILDLIDMDRAANREKVRRRLEQLLAKDKAKTTLNRISELGLIEMTRKRTRESLGRLMNEPCFYCDGTGNLQSKQTVAYEILRQIKRERTMLRGYSVTVNAHPAVVDLMKNEERTAVQEAERRYQRRIELVPRKEYHLEQFDLIGK